MAALYVVGIVYALCLAYFVRAMIVAPRGFEDAAGFHFGNEPEDPYVDRPLKPFRRQRSRKRRAVA